MTTFENKTKDKTFGFGKVNIWFGTDLTDKKMVQIRLFRLMVLIKPHGKGFLFSKSNQKQSGTGYVYHFPPYLELKMNTY